MLIYGLPSFDHKRFCNTENGINFLLPIIIIIELFWRKSIICAKENPCGRVYHTDPWCPLQDTIKQAGILPRTVMKWLLSSRKMQIYSSKVSIFKDIWKELRQSEFRHWPLCYTWIGYHRSMVRLKLYCLKSVDHNLLCRHSPCRR